MSKTSIEIKKIKEIAYNYKLLAAKDIATFNKENLYTGFGPSFDADLDNNEFIVTLTIVYEYKMDKNVNVELLKIETEFRFFISDLSKIYKAHKESFELPDAIMELTVGTAISSIRGMIAVKTAGNFLTDYPLPLLDINGLLKNIKSKIKPQAKRTPIKKVAKSSVTPRKKNISKT